MFTYQEGGVCASDIVSFQATECILMKQMLSPVLWFQVEMKLVLLRINFYNNVPISDKKKKSCYVESMLETVKAKIPVNNSPRIEF